MTGIIQILQILSSPYALPIIHFIYQKGMATLSEIMTELRALSKYKTIRNTVEKLVEAGILKRNIEGKGAVKTWKLTLTVIGEKIAHKINNALKEIFKEITT